MKKISGSGFVIDKTRINDNKLIIKLLDKNDRLFSVIFRKGKQSKSIPSFLDAVDFVTVENSKTGIPMITELAIQPSFRSQPGSENKLDYYYFLADVLRSIGNRVEVETGLYDLVCRYYGYLFDELSPDLLISFLFDLLTVFGVCPVYVKDAKYLDFRDGSFCQLMPSHPDFCDAKLFLGCSFFTNENSHNSLLANSSSRLELISLLIRYFEFQKGISIPVKSLEVLRDLRK